MDCSRVGVHTEFISVVPSLYSGIERYTISGPCVSDESTVDSLLELLTQSDTYIAQAASVVAYHTGEEFLDMCSNVRTAVS